MSKKNELRVQKKQILENKKTQGVEKNDSSIGIKNWRGTGRDYCLCHSGNCIFKTHLACALAPISVGCCFSPTSSTYLQTSSTNKDGTTPKEINCHKKNARVATGQNGEGSSRAIEASDRPSPDLQKECAKGIAKTS